MVRQEIASEPGNKPELFFNDFLNSSPEIRVCDLSASSALSVAGLPGCRHCWLVLNSTGKLLLLVLA